MGAIDIGHGAAVGDGPRTYGYTSLDLTNPANATGTIDTFEAYSVSTEMSNTKIGTFSGSSLSWDDRDYETVGTVTIGAKRTFTGLDCDVATDDIIGAYWTLGYLYFNSADGSGRLWKSGDWFGSGAQTYSLTTTDWLALYGTGATPEIPKTSSDTGSGADAILVGNPLAALSQSETGSGADSLPVRSSILFETGGGSELSLALATLLGSDIGEGADAKDSASPAAVVTGNDSGHCGQILIG